MMKTVAILGSTGSIGRNTLKVISRLNRKFKVVALATGKNSQVLAKQINRLRPKLAAIMDESKVNALKKAIHTRTKLFAGQKAIEQVANCGADIIVMAIGGSTALLPTLKSLDKSRRLALANKECLVMAGNIIMQQARKHEVEIIPIDSEQSAIFQCLKDEGKNSLEKIYLTCSGGPLKDMSQEELEYVKPDFALRHPRWKMGKKISIDSATLMNKGLEVIEANYLFDLPVDKIKVVIHPEALVHSLVQFLDGTIIAQLSRADMRIPIQYALTYPERFPVSMSKLDFSQTRNLSFHLPDLSKFPCLRLALAAARERGLAGCVLNASDEECVAAFLEGKIRLTDIAWIIEKVLAKLKNKLNPTLQEILQADQWARDQVRTILGTVPHNSLFCK
jgi:1-deoxy-D-xylulose-5-phosphate reductoisomerase